MKKQKLFMAFCALLVGWSNASADPVGVELSTGSNYYLFNLGSKKYMTVGQIWGSRANVSESEAIPLQITAGGTDGTYKLITKVNGDATGLFIDDTPAPYLDSGSLVDLTFEKQGDENVYKIKGNSKEATPAIRYIKWDGTNDALIAGDAEASGDNDKWIITTEDNIKADLITRMGQATVQNPVNVTLFVKSARPAWGTSRFWPYTNWTNGNAENADNRHSGGSAAVMGFWGHSDKDIYQEITVPKGKYKVRCLGFARAGDWQNNYCWEHRNDQRTVVYISSGGNSGEHVLTSIFEGAQTSPLGEENKQSKYNLDGGVDKYIPNAPLAAAFYFSRNKYTTWAEASTTVEDGSVRIGVRNTSNQWEWVEVSQFELLYLGSIISGEAVALPVGGAMEANTWYYFDVPSTSGYNLTATALGDIVYTTDGTILIEDQASVTTNFSSTNPVNLTEGRYYIKSTTANNFAFEADVKSYAVGAATAKSIADNSYIQSLTTASFTFGSAETNDLTATLAIQGTPNAVLNDGTSNVANGALTFNASTKVVTATFTSVTLDPSKTYTITLPEDAIAWDKSLENGNSEAVITFKTPVVFDGTYYLYSEVFDQFLSRGSWWGTRAVADIYGTPVTLTTDANNLTTIMMVDNSGYIKDSYWLYTDGGIGDANHFVIQNSTVEGYEGYQFKTNELGGTNYLYVNSAASDTGSDSHGVAGNSIISPNEGYNITDWNQTVWQLMSLSDHDTKVNAYPTTNKTSVITASGISTTAGAFETYLSTNYYANDKSSLITPVSSGNAKGSGWEWSPTARTEDDYPSYQDPYASLYKNTGYYTYTISSSNLPAGIYKVQMSAFDRRKGPNDEHDLYVAYGNIGASYLKVNDQQVRIMSSEEMFGIDYAGNRTWAGQLASLNAGDAINVIYVYLDGSTDMTLKVEKPDHNSAGSCLVFGDFKLTYYDANLSQRISSAGWATLYTPNALDFSDVAGLTAYTATCSEGVVTLTPVGKVPANTGVVLEGDEGSYDIPVIASSSTAKGDLQGSTTDATAYNAFSGYTLYVLTTVDDGANVQFNPVTSGSIAAGKAFLKIEEEGETPARAMRVVFADEITGVKNVEAVSEAAQKDGKYIENGKLVIMKNGMKFNANGQQMK